MDKPLTIVISPRIPPYIGGERGKVDCVMLGGVDITHYVSGIEIKAGVHEVTDVTLHLLNVEVVTKDSREADNG